MARGVSTRRPSSGSAGLRRTGWWRSPRRPAGCWRWPPSSTCLPRETSTCQAGRSDVRDRVDEVAELLAERVDQAHAAGAALAGRDVAELIRAAVDDVRRRPRPLAPGPLPATTDERVLECRKLVEQLYAGAAELGKLALKIAPAYLSDSQALYATRLAEFADEIGSTADD